MLFELLCRAARRAPLLQSFDVRRRRSYNSFDLDSDACVRNEQVFEDMGPAIASSIKNEQNVRVAVLCSAGCVRAS